MAKSGGKRHSRTVMQPVTINLEATQDEAETRSGKDAAETPSDVSGASATAAEAASQAPGSAGEPAGGDGSGGPGEPAAPEPPAPSSRRGTLISAVAGAIIAVAIFAALQWAGWLPQRKPDLSGLQQLPGAVSAIEERVGNLERSLADISIPGADTGQLGARIGSAESAVKSLDSRLTDSLSGMNGQISSLSARLDAVQKRVDDLASAGANGGTADMKALSDRISALQKQLDDAAASRESARAAVQQQIAGLKSEIARLSKEVDKAAGQPNVAGAIAAAALKSAIDRGVPFTSELDTYAAVAGAGPEIATLRKFAAKGVPTQADLNRQIARDADRIIAASRPRPPDEGVIARLMASARSLVKVRPVGEVTGDTPEAIVARMEADINAGRLDAALEEYDALPEPGKQAAASLAEDIRARRTADTILEKTISGALSPAAGSGN